MADRATDRRLAYSAAEVAEYLGVTDTHIRNLMRDGTIPSLKLGARRLIRADVLDRLLAELEAEQAVADAERYGEGPKKPKAKRTTARRAAGKVPTKKRRAS